MKDATCNITTLHDLLDYDVRKLASAEKQVEVILPIWIDKANSVELKKELSHYHAIVTQHNQKLQEVINDEGINCLSRISDVMAALVIETRERLLNCTNMELRDASLLSGIQEIIHYKISLYGALAAFSKYIGNTNAAHTFHNALLEEKEIDNKLSEMAEKEINLRANTTMRLTAKT